MNRFMAAIVLAWAFAAFHGRSQTPTTDPIRAGSVSENPTTSTDGKQYLPWDKGSVALGGYVTFFNSTVSFGLNNAPGVKINGEDVLGLDSRLTVFRVDAMFRPGASRRNQVDFSYASYDRSGSATLSKELTIDGITYPVGAHVDSVLNFDIIRATYSYALIQDERMRIALGAGAYAIPLKYGLNIQTEGGRSAVEGANTTLPFPALALRVEFQIIPKLFLNGGVEGMYLPISDFKASILDATAGLEYRPWKHIGLGLGYGFTGVHVNAESSKSSYPGGNFVGSVDVTYSGLLAYGKFAF
jgi:hypothetical protein